MFSGWDHWPNNTGTFISYIWKIFTVPAPSLAGLGDVEAFALKVFPPEMLAPLAENSPFHLLFLLFYQRHILRVTQSQAVGLHSLNGPCVTVKCIHLFHWVATGNVLCMCFGAVGGGRCFVFTFCLLWWPEAFILIRNFPLGGEGNRWSVFKYLMCASSTLFLESVKCG